MRKWTYLVATLLMAGTTATFTGCIDTDEPEGIVDLRGAKSELIKAQAAVKLVEVEWQKAKVAYQELENKSKELSNQYQEYDNQMHALDVKLKELEVERAQAATEREKAEAEAKIAQANRDKAFWENKMAEEAEIFKASLLTYQTATAQAQEAYDNAMKLIEAGKLLLSDGEKAIINKAQQRLFVASASLQEYYGWLKTAQDEYDVAIMAKKTRTLPQLEATLKLAELAVERQEKVVKENERLLALADEFNSANWDAEVKNLDKQIQDAKTEQGEAEKKKSSIINNAEYHKAATALKLEQDTLGTDVDAPTAKTAWGVYNKAVADSTQQCNNVNLKIKEFKSEPVNAAIKELFNKAGAYYDLSGYTRDGVFSYATATYTQSDYNADLKALDEAEDPTTVTLNSVPSLKKAQVEAWIKYVKDFGVSGESVAQQQALLKNKEAAQTKAAEAYTKGLAEWQVLVDAVSSNGENIKAVPTDKDAENEPSIKTAVTTYNTAITALNAAVTAYNKAFEDSYKKAYDKSLADAKEKKYIELLIADADAAGWTTFIAANPNATNAEKIAKLENDLVIPSKTTAAKKAAEDYIKTDAVIAAAKAAGDTAWKDPEKKENEKAVAEAEKAAKEAYNSISPAKARYESLAATYYGQTLKNSVALEGVGGITGESSSFVENDSDKPGYLKAPKTTISDDNFTKLTAVEYNDNIAKGSLAYLSRNAFGNRLGMYDGMGRLTPVTEEDVRKYVEDYNVAVNASNFGLLGTKIETADAVQLCKDLIAAKDKLDEVLAMLNEVLANLEAEIKVNDAKMDPFIAATAEKLAAVEKAQADVEAAEDAKNAFTTDIDAEILSCQGLVKDLEAIKTNLVAQINSITGGGTTNPITAEQYADMWKNNVALAEQALANYKEAVGVANESIELYKAGKYTLAYNVQKAELKMNKAKEAYDIALAIYDKALADVQNVIATLTK